MSNFNVRASLPWIALLLSLSSLVYGAQAAEPNETLEVDASQPAPKIESGYFRFGTATGPGGTLSINNLYLSRNGTPWLPVMGEFHYSRFPNQYWDEELAKIKASGVDVIATYIIWNHHQEFPKSFDWSGDRDLRKFVTLCAKHNLKVWLRLGPWDHAEVRFGGIPDWVVQSQRTRSNDPAYLKLVARLYGEIGQQVHGLLWKNGGPVIGVQLENEYNLIGPGRGREHIMALKKLALAAGLDVPYYTVTGWDGTQFPEHEVTPVFGGYPDEPWSTSTGILPPKETYLFRFSNRVSGDLGAQTTGRQQGDAELDRSHTPFLGAEFGGGVPIMYRRRPSLTPDDIAAMLPVELGSGVNLYGYYMYHGGSNPDAPTTLEENTLLGGFNDLPIKNYDFQAPFGEYGQSGALVDKLRPFHYFLKSFGDLLAPMTVRAPSIVPSDPGDLKTLRFSIRSRGNSGFLFVNNYVRQYEMAEHKAVRFSVKYSDGTLTFPDQPIDIKNGAYFIWPIHMDLSGADLVFATAQPMTELQADSIPVYVFHANGDIPANFRFSSSTVSSISLRGNQGTVTTVPETITATPAGAHNTLIDLTLRTGAHVHILLLTDEQAQHATILSAAKGEILVLSPAEIFQDRGEIVLRSTDVDAFHIAVFPKKKLGFASAQEKSDDLFDHFQFKITPRTLKATVTQDRPAGIAPKIRIDGPASAAVEPYPEAFGAAGSWRISIPKGSLRGLSDVYMRIAYRGDVARLVVDHRFLDDQFYYGAPWDIGLKRFAGLLEKPWELTIMPLREDAPIYLPGMKALPFNDRGQIADIRSVSLIPEYQAVLHLEPVKN